MIYIFTTQFGYYISHALQYLFMQCNIPSEIIYEIDLQKTDLHILLFSQKVKQFPKQYILYQLEQKDISSWIDQRYELSILFSQCTIDYSQSNIRKFSEIIQQKMIYFPVPFVSSSLIWKELVSPVNPPIQILFYGSMNTLRRQKLNYLQRKLFPRYSIHIVQQLYGYKLLERIMQSKIVLNLHFYKNAILETCRINEILSCQKIVISEYPNSIDIENYNLYQSHCNVIFAKNMNEMAQKIIKCLEHPMNNLPTYTNSIEEQTKNLYKIIEKFI